VTESGLCPCGWKATECAKHGPYARDRAKRDPAACDWPLCNCKSKSECVAAAAPAITTAADIGGKLMEGYVLAVARLHTGPLGFMLVGRPLELKPGGSLHGKPASIAVSENAGLEILAQGFPPNNFLHVLPMHATARAPGYIDTLLLPAGYDYYVYLQ
jgi:hypothetical protein